MELRLPRNDLDEAPRIARLPLFGLPEAALPGEVEQSRRLRRLLFWLALVFPLFALGDLLMWHRLSVPGLQYAALFVTSLLIPTWIAARLNAQGRTALAAQVVAYSLLMLCVVDAWVSPVLWVEMTLGCLLSVIVALPYVYERRLRWLLRVAFVAACWTAAAGFWPRFQPVPGVPLGQALLHFTGIVAAATLSLFAVGHFSDRLCDLLRRESFSHARTLAAEQRSRFLASFSAALAETLDTREVLERAARRTVDGMADWCTISIQDENGTMQRLEAAHRDPSKRTLLESYLRASPASEHRSMLLAEVFRTGRSVLVESVSAQDLPLLAQNSEHVEQLRELGVGSFILAPLRAHGRVLGVIALVRESRSTPFRQEDVMTTEDLGIRAGLALENASLFDRVRKAVQVRESFLGVAGHELKTPLAVLKLQVQLLAREAQRGSETILASDVMLRVGRLDRSLERMQRLVNDLLDVSQISAGRLAITREDLDLVAVTRDVVSVLAGLPKAAPILVDGPASLDGRWDRLRLEQVLMNLLTNALKYGQDKPVHVSLSSAGELAVIEVRDEGIGIAPQDQQRIFERFERAAPSEHYGGLGLGLWISKEVVRAHGGTIEVRSRCGEGATFVVRLPRHGA